MRPAGNGGSAEPGQVRLSRGDPFCRVWGGRPRCPEIRPCEGARGHSAGLGWAEPPGQLACQRGAAGQILGWEQDDRVAWSRLREKGGHQRSPLLGRRRPVSGRVT